MTLGPLTREVFASQKDLRIDSLPHWLMFGLANRPAWIIRLFETTVSCLMRVVSRVFGLPGEEAISVSVRDRTQQRILNAAGEVFAEHGFEHATIREIIMRAEANLAAVNYYFGGKEQLYRQTLQYAQEEAIRQVPLPPREPETPPEARLKDFVRTMLQRMLSVEHLPWQARLMMREFTHPTGLCQEVVEEYIRPHHEQLVAVLREMVPVDCPPVRVQQLAFSVVGQCLFYKLSDPVVSFLVSKQDLRDHFSLDALIDHITGVMLAALGRTPLIPHPATLTAAASRPE